MPTSTYERGLLKLAAALVCGAVITTVLSSPLQCQQKETLSTSLSPSYATTGKWNPSGVRGHSTGAGSAYTFENGATAQWKPAFGEPVRARVSFYKIVHKSANDGRLQLKVRAGGKEKTVYVDHTQGKSEWLDLGFFDFKALPEEGVYLTKISDGSATRISAVRFDLMDATGQSVIQTLMLDKPTSGSLIVTLAPPVRFKDVAGLDAEREIEALSLDSILTETRSGQFAPHEPLTNGTLAVWVTRMLRSYQTNHKAQTPSEAAPTPKIQQQALADLRAQNIALSSEIGAPITAGEMRGLLSALLAKSGRNLQWQKADAKENAREFDWLSVNLASDVPALAADAPLTRSNGAVFLRRYAQTILEAGPPASKQWQLTFHDDFETDGEWQKHWKSSSGPSTHIRSGRYPENVAVENGLLRLLTKKENRGGQQWTSGNLWTRDFKQKFGYFEARFRIGTSPGLNNAFWMMNPRKSSDVPGQHEIDIVEAKHPNMAVLSLHDWSGEHKSSSDLYRARTDLSKDFHVYGMEWNEKEFVFYFDGRETWRAKKTIDTQEYPLRFSTAVGLGGKITDALDGTSMDVDWVRAYQRKTP